MTTETTLTYRGQPLLFLDVEASSLAPDGYPIEIGWASASVEPSAEPWASFLIRPTIDWREKGHWSDDSARVHRIPFNLLMRDGCDVMDVVPILDRAFADRMLVSDAIDSDIAWIAKLYDAANRSCPWRLYDLDLARSGIAAERNLNPRKAFAALEAAEAAYPRPHRAGPDAARMLRLTQVMLAAGRRT
jgi:hypothetical protein